MPQESSGRYKEPSSIVPSMNWGVEEVSPMTETSMKGVMRVPRPGVAFGTKTKGKSKTRMSQTLEKTLMSLNKDLELIVS